MLQSLVHVDMISGFLKSTLLLIRSGYLQKGKGYWKHFFIFSFRVFSIFASFGQNFFFIYLYTLAINHHFLSPMSIEINHQHRQINTFFLLSFWLALAPSDPCEEALSSLLIQVFAPTYEKLFFVSLLGIDHRFFDRYYLVLDVLLQHIQILFYQDFCSLCVPAFCTINFRF